MSDAPVIFKRKGRATQRARPSTNDTESTALSSGVTTEADEEGTESPSALANKLKKARSKPKPRATVSFGGDEEVSGCTRSAGALAKVCLGVGRRAKGRFSRSRSPI
jgi:hypothetical protein